MNAPMCRRGPELKPMFAQKTQLRDHTQVKKYTATPLAALLHVLQPLHGQPEYEAIILRLSVPLLEQFPFSFLASMRRLVGAR